jgi:hypothetical protein
LGQRLVGSEELVSRDMTAPRIDAGQGELHE